METLCKEELLVYLLAESNSGEFTVDTIDFNLDEILSSSLLVSRLKILRVHLWLRDSQKSVKFEVNKLLSEPTQLRSLMNEYVEEIDDDQFDATIAVSLQNVDLQKIRESVQLYLQETSNDSGRNEYENKIAPRRQITFFYDFLRQLIELVGNEFQFRDKDFYQYVNRELSRDDIFTDVIDVLLIFTYLGLIKVLKISDGDGELTFKVKINPSFLIFDYASLDREFDFRDLRTEVLKLSGNHKYSPGELVLFFNSGNTVTLKLKNGTKNDNLFRIFYDAFCNSDNNTVSLSTEFIMNEYEKRFKEKLSSNQVSNTIRQLRKKIESLNTERPEIVELKSRISFSCFEESHSGFSMMLKR